MPAISNVRTPTWFVAMPIRTAAARQVVRREELVQRGGERRDVADLAVDDDATREGLTRKLAQMRRAVVLDPSRCELRGAELEPHELARLPLLGDRARLAAF